MKKLLLFLFIASSIGCQVIIPDQTIIRAVTIGKDGKYYGFIEDTGDAYWIESNTPLHVGDTITLKPFKQ